MVLDGSLAERRARRRHRAGRGHGRGHRREHPARPAPSGADVRRPRPARRSRPSAIYLVLMVGLILADVSLSVIIALSGLLPLLSGAISGVVVRRRGLAIRPPGAQRDPRHTAAIVPTAGWLLVIELSNLAMYASGRIILGAYRTPRAVGLYEGPVRAHNLLYALGGRARGAHRADRLALRRHGRRPPPARAGGAREPLHARAVRAAVRDADGHVEADRGRVARRHATRTAPPRCRSSCRTGSCTAR